MDGAELVASHSFLFTSGSHWFGPRVVLRAAPNVWSWENRFRLPTIEPHCSALPKLSPISIQIYQHINKEIYMNRGLEVPTVLSLYPLDGRLGGWISENYYESNSDKTLKQHRLVTVRNTTCLLVHVWRKGTVSDKRKKTHLNGVLLSEHNAINTPVSDWEPKNQAAVSLETIVNREFRFFLWLTSCTVAVHVFWKQPHVKALWETLVKKV
jgi:hypothetical protein